MIGRTREARDKGKERERLRIGRIAELDRVPGFSGLRRLLDHGLHNQRLTTKYTRLSFLFVFFLLLSFSLSLSLSLSLFLLSLSLSLSRSLSPLLIGV